MTHLLAYYGWHYSLSTLATWWKPSNGGIFMASKWPIVASQHMVYEACRQFDCLAAKGVQYIGIEKRVDGRSKRYHVFGTHMQAYGGVKAAEVRKRQALEMATFITRQAISAREPVIVAGDFNIRGPASQAFQELIDTLQVAMPVIVGDRRATMDVDNTLFGRGPWWVDYVLPSTVHQGPTRASIEALALRPERTFATCFAAMLQPYYVSPYASTCTETLQVRDLSDHYPVIGRFEYTN
jgi:endonuclease/exonuclease/phosphatase family metal-dependent hydrolase